MNRIHKVLEDANIKLGTVVSDILGVSGRAILAALVAGESDPQRLADATTGRLQAKPEEIRQALRGHVREHHRFLLRTHLTMIDAVDEQVATLEARIDRASAPLEEAVSRLDGVPGISRSSAHAILAEIGHDMTRFPTAAHLVSFAGLCPRLAESAGKKKSTKTRKGSTWLKTVLVSCAWGAVRTKNTYARAQYHRLKSRRGPKKAIVAVAASLLTAVYYMLRANTPYRDLGANYFDRQSPHQAARRLCRRLEALGFTVNITPQAAATA
jgi:transposase